MLHFPITTVEDKEQGVFIIRQPLSLAEDDFVEIKLGKDQLLALSTAMLKFIERKQSDAVPGTAEHFDTFWFAYPAKKRMNRDGCIKKWKQRRLDDKAASIVNHVRNMAASGDWQKEGGKYVPNITTYLNQSRWEAGAEEGGDSWLGQSV